MERIRRAGSQFVEGSLPEGLDVGFRVLSVDDSNLADILRTPDELRQEELTLYTSSLKADRTDEDLLFQVLLDWGLDLASPISTESLAERPVCVVDDGALIACFADAVSVETISAIAERQPLRAVFRDSAFETDAARINAEQIFRERSPGTEVKAI
jgi:adenine-specific DNA-methyltransferase